MAPELNLGTVKTASMKYLKSADVWSLGMTLFELVNPDLKYPYETELKYNFTPDDFKAATRSQRQQKKSVDVTHLKTSDEMLTMEKIDRRSIVSSSEGKSLSVYIWLEMQVNYTFKLT